MEIANEPVYQPLGIADVQSPRPERHLLRARTPENRVHPGQNCDRRDALRCCPTALDTTIASPGLKSASIIPGLDSNNCCRSSPRAAPAPAVSLTLAAMACATCGGSRRRLEPAFTFITGGFLVSRSLIRNSFCCGSMERMTPAKVRK